MLLCEPYYWGMRLAVMDFELEVAPARAAAWTLVALGQRSCSTPTPSTATRQVAAAVRAQHDNVVAYVNSSIGTSAQALSAARAVVEDVPIIDFVNYVQADAVKAGADRRRRGAAGAVDRRAVQPHRVVPGRARSPCATWPGSTSTTTRCSA